MLDSAVPRLGRYRLLDKLGEGGQGVVYRAEDPADGSIVAIKILRTDRVDNPEVLRRFRKEARLMAEANNPYVVNLLEYNEEDGIPYMVLEFVAGESLGRLAGERSPARRKGGAGDHGGGGRGLMEAHERGIVHRDIKPSNILLLEPQSLRPASPIERDGFALAQDLSPEPRLTADPEAVALCVDRAGPIEADSPRLGSRSPTSGWPGTSSTPNRWP